MLKTFKKIRPDAVFAMTVGLDYPEMIRTKLGEFTTHANRCIECRPTIYFTAGGRGQRRYPCPDGLKLQQDAEDLRNLARATQKPI